ncbi:Mre11 DNA-binding presumed domain-containing protein [Elsinoe ampelina]|uniref:Double-strand break repair protein n=1 Tax=Elsinoe ampelina TaxID=302913 RepID=A0A6A6GNF2_9PEZI|nr:Mre11 DNA-binding presumed domain-containing protein [Elsinoe ampelina]
MVQYSTSDTIRILVSTDNHVGYQERDSERGNDSTKAFEEIMNLAKERDVDMVLLAGDLFHENKPSRKAMHEVMKSLRMNCFGDKPCELQMLSDAGEVFHGPFNHANYEDENLNVAIPVFSIHGNHDDPSGEGHFSALDILQMGGLINYYGRVPEADAIEVKPVLLQKGRTKLALYGLSNVRDERLFRTFRDGKVKFFQPGTQKSDWFNLMSVHQNHYAHTDTSYLPEHFLPGFLDLVVWGHEHECLIDPKFNPDTGFHVMQPGSSIATSLCLGEAVPKQVTILSITGKEFKTENIRLKSVRPFNMREIVLQDDKNMKAIAKKSENRTAVTKYLTAIVDEMIEEARNSWVDLQEEVPEDEKDWPKPLIRLRVEYTAPEGGKFDCENPQRFSNRFVERVANKNDVVQFYRKKAKATSRSAAKPEQPDEEVLAQLSIDTIKVDKLVKEFLLAQSLTILPQNSFGEAVDLFVDKDDGQAVKNFVTESLENQVKHLLDNNENLDDEDMANAMEEYKAKLEGIFKEHAGKFAKNKTATRKPANWDSDMDGPFDGGSVNGAANGHDDEDDYGSPTPKPRKGRTTAKTNGTTARKTGAAKKTAAKPAAKKTTGRGKKAVVSEDEDEDEDEDVVMIDDDEDEEPEEEDDDVDAEEESQGLFVSTAKKPAARSTRAAPKRAASPKKTSRAAATKSKSQASSSTQSKLNFSQPARPAKAAASRRVQEISDDEISDDDAFEPAPAASRSTRGRR